MSSGLTFNNTVSNLKVKVGNKVLIGTAETGETDDTSNTDAPTLVYTANGFNLTFDMTKFQDQKGDAITVTYSAIVNDNAVATVTNNSAVLQYSNNPADSSSTATTPPEEVEVYTSQIVVDKYKDGATSTKLANAKFILVKKTTTGEAPNQVTTETYYKYTAAANGNPARVEWVADKTQATEVTTNASGAASFAGLEDGTYYLRETAAP
jgi:fimbrial isopeptide formation D2 family protein